MGYGDFGPEMLELEGVESVAADSEETETCVGCGLTVEVNSPVFLEWEADVVGWSTCPDCRDSADYRDAGGAPKIEALGAARRRAA